MADDFKAGDLVRLKSGGPDMTVGGFGEGPGGMKGPVCFWFVGTERHQGVFPAATLAKMEDSPAKTPAPAKPAQPPISERAGRMFGNRGRK